MHEKQVFKYSEVFSCGDMIHAERCVEAGIVDECPEFSAGRCSRVGIVPSCSMRVMSRTSLWTVISGSRDASRGGGVILNGLLLRGRHPQEPSSGGLCR